MLPTMLCAMACEVGEAAHILRLPAPLLLGLRHVEAREWVVQELVDSDRLPTWPLSYANNPILNLPKSEATSEPEFAQLHRTQAQTPPQPDSTLLGKAPRTLFFTSKPLGTGAGGERGSAGQWPKTKCLRLLLLHVQAPQVR